MKAITILQPWAWLLASGKKHCETRPWKTDYRGEILIHAGKKDFTNALRQTILEERYMRKAGVFDTEMITGAIIGKAKLVNCVFVDEAIQDLMRKQHMQEYVFGYFVKYQYAWVFEEAELFERPFPTTGKRGLWDFNEKMCLKRMENETGE